MHKSLASVRSSHSQSVSKPLFCWNVGEASVQCFVWWFFFYSRPLLTFNIKEKGVGLKVVGLFIKIFSLQVQNGDYRDLAPNLYYNLVLFLMAINLY